MGKLEEKSPFNPSFESDKFAPKVARSRHRFVVCFWAPLDWGPGSYQACTNLNLHLVNLHNRKRDARLHAAQIDSPSLVNMFLCCCGLVRLPLEETAPAGELSLEVLRGSRRCGRLHSTQTQKKSPNASNVIYRCNPLLCCDGLMTLARGRVVGTCKICFVAQPPTRSSSQSSISN